MSKWIDYIVNESKKDNKLTKKQESILRKYVIKKQTMYYMKKIAMMILWKCQRTCLLITIQYLIKMMYSSCVGYFTNLIGIDSIYKKRNSKITTTSNNISGRTKKGRKSKSGYCRHPTCAGKGNLFYFRRK